MQMPAVVCRRRWSYSDTLLSPMALFVLFSAPAGTGVIAADFVFGAVDSLWCRRLLAAVKRELGLGTRQQGRRGRSGRRRFLLCSLHAEEAFEGVRLDPLHHPGE